MSERGGYAYPTRVSADAGVYHAGANHSELFG